MKSFIYFHLCIICLFILGSKSEQQQADKSPRPIQILLLGHDSEHHNSEVYMPMPASALSKKGINLTYTEQVEDLNPETLNKYDGLIIYANHEKINPSQEEALLEFVEGGKGFIPVHSASFCFQNSEEYIELASKFNFPPYNSIIKSHITIDGKSDNMIHINRFTI